MPLTCSDGYVEEAVRSLPVFEYLDVDALVELAIEVVGSSVSRVGFGIRGSGLHRLIDSRWVEAGEFVRMSEYDT